MRDALFPDPEALASICRKHRIRLLSVFGSTLIGMARIEIELSSLLNGRKVDLRTAQDLSRHFRDEVLQTAAIQYAA
jgi:predicted nucleotidyltransferase